MDSPALRKRMSRNKCGQGRVNRHSQFEPEFGSGEVNCCQSLFVTRIRAAGFDAGRRHACTRKTARTSIGRPSATWGINEKQEKQLVWWSGGGGEQARGRLSHALDRHQNRVLGGKGGPGLAPGSFLFFRSSNGKPHQSVQDVCSCTSADVNNVIEALATADSFDRRTLLVMVLQ